MLTLQRTYDKTCLNGTEGSVYSTTKNVLYSKFVLFLVLQKKNISRKPVMVRNKKKTIAMDLMIVPMSATDSIKITISTKLQNKEDRGMTMLDQKTVIICMAQLQSSV